MLTEIDANMTCTCFLRARMVEEKVPRMFSKQGTAMDAGDTVDLVRGKVCIVPYGKNDQDKSPEKSKVD